MYRIYQHKQVAFVWQNWTTLIKKRIVRQVEWLAGNILKSMLCQLWHRLKNWGMSTLQFGVIVRKQTCLIIIFTSSLAPDLMNWWGITWITCHSIVNQAIKILSSSDTSVNQRYKHRVLQMFSVTHIDEYWRSENSTAQK